jgi:PmbA protein
MSAELTRRAAQAVELAKKAGADNAWSTVSQSRDVQFQYRDGSLEKVKDTTSQSLGIRIYAGGRYSSHSTTDLNPARLQGFVSQAVAITGALEPDEYRRITPQELFGNRPQDELDLVDASVAALDREQRIAWCKTLDDAVHRHDRVISATSAVYDGTQQSASASSNGFLGEQRSTYCWLTASVTLRDQGDKRAEDGFYAGGAHISDLPGPDEVGGTALERALSRLDSDKGPTVKTTMVVDARAAASLMGRADRRGVVQQGTDDRRRPIDRPRPGIPSLRR